VDTFDHLLDTLIREVPERLICEMLAKKFAEQGVLLSERERKKLARIVHESGDVERFRIRRRWWKWWDKRSVTIEFTHEDIDKVQRTATEFYESGLPEVIRTATDETSQAMLVDLKKRWISELRAQRRDLARFKSGLRKRWQAPLDALKMLVTIAREAGQTFTSALAESPDANSREHLIEVMGRLHARACQVAEEVVCLLEGGFADGAMARWRTLHEIAVVSFLIADRGEHLAERYVLHQAVESKRAADEYQEHHEALGYEPISKDEMKSIHEACDEVAARFGSEIRGRTDYEWAREYLDLKDKKKPPSFRDIEAAVGIHYLRPYFRLACHNVHANAKGAFFRLGLLSETDTFLAGPSDAGFEDPGQCTALSLSHVCAAHFSVIKPTTIDHLVLLNIVRTLVPEIAEGFAQVHQNMLTDEA
jgi:hypothetical protein